MSGSGRASAHVADGSSSGANDRATSYRRIELAREAGIAAVSPEEPKRARTRGVSGPEIDALERGRKPARGSGGRNAPSRRCAPDSDRRPNRVSGDHLKRRPALAHSLRENGRRNSSDRGHGGTPN